MNHRTAINPARPTSLLALLVIVGLAPVSTQLMAESPDTALVRRDQVQLTLSGAELIIAASRVKAQEIDVKVNIAVVDSGGHLIAFARMDGARPASSYTAITKATAAATKLGDTGPLPNAEATDTHLSLAVENAAAISGGKFTTLHGGVAIVVDGQVIGAVGVGGARGEQDAEVARGGIDALLSELKLNDASGNQSSEGSVPAALLANWLVEDIEGRGVIDNAQTTIQFNADGSAHGSTGLNRFMANPTTGEGEVTFGDFPMTRRAGPPALMDQEAKFLAAMQKVRRYRLDENQLLRLLDSDGKELMRLAQIPAPDER